MSALGTKERILQEGRTDKQGQIWSKHSCRSNKVSEQRRFGPIQAGLSRLAPYGTVHTVLSPDQARRGRSNRRTKTVQRVERNPVVDKLLDSCCGPEQTLVRSR